MSKSLKNLKSYNFKGNRVKIFILPEIVFESALKGNKTDVEIMEYVKQYIETTPNIDKARLYPSQDAEVTFEPEITEEVVIPIGMDPYDTEIIAETPTVKNYLFKTSAYLGDNIYLLEQLFNGVKVFTTTDGKLGYKALDKTVESSSKGSIVVVQSVRTGNICAGYRFIPNTGYTDNFKGKDIKASEIELKQVRDDYGLMFFNTLMNEELTSESFEELPKFQIV